MLDEHARLSDRSMPSSHTVPGPSARKRASTYLAPPQHSPRKRLKSPIGPDEAANIPQFKAEMWFDHTNKDASGMNDIHFQDNDPPFYLSRRSSADGSSACAVPSITSNSSRLGPPTAPTRSLLARLDSSESNSEDFRSVIDDLTIQNKKLKQKLKKYQRLHCSHLQEEKLFEIRIHGLAAHRRRDLEETLRSFASSIDENSSDRPPIGPMPLKSSNLTQPHSSLHKPSSSSTSYSKPIDSAYASMSGQTSGLSNSQLPDQNQHDSLGRGSRAKQLNVKSYLHHMPQNLLPKHTLAMSERSKSKLVVKRLEQIYTGKGAASRPHNQSHQQQEVSQSAAQADRHGSESRGRPSTREGIREAHILPAHAELQLDTMSEINVAAQQSRNDRRTSTSCSTQASRDESPEQRPTRPLDLDPYRAQVPSDNIEYIRHLGLDTRASNPESDEDGWVYLNLLTSMAQLHTLSVTPEFVRQAITNFSTKFELSASGTKVRWQGGEEGTRMSPESDESEDHAHIKSTATSLSVSKRGSITDLSSRDDRRQPSSALLTKSSKAVKVGKRSPVVLGQSMPDSKFHYKPLFFHGASTNSDDSGQSSNSSSDIIETATGLDTGMKSGSQGIWEAEATLRRHNFRGNGPIIFYHQARFCTDLSADPSGASIDDGAYHRLTETPVGCCSLSYVDGGDETPSDHSIDWEQNSDWMKFEVESPQKRSSLDLDDLKSSISDCAGSTTSSPPNPVDMEVSGLGGIQPADNFILRVQVRHERSGWVKSPPNLPASRVRGSRRLLHRLLGAAAKVMHERQIPRSQPQLEIVSTVKTDMPPSSLPPPSFLCNPFSSTDSDVSEGGSDDHGVNVSTDSYHSPHHHKFASRPRRQAKVNSTSRPSKLLRGSSPEESSGSSYASTSSHCESDDSSIDLLAHARVLDPDAIAEREREFDRNAGNSYVLAPNVLPEVSSSAASSGEASGIASNESDFPTATKVAESDIDSMSVDVMSAV